MLITAKRRELSSIANWNKDEWDCFADLLANLIEKYATTLDIDNLPEPINYFGEKNVEIVNNVGKFENTLENIDNL